MPALPDDYEPCEECGYDHEYEWEEAQQVHCNQLARPSAIAGNNRGVQRASGWYIVRINVSYHRSSGGSD